MTMTGAERERLMRLGENTATLTAEVGHMKETMGRLGDRIEEMHDYLKGITADITSIRVQNEGHEEKLSMLQELTSSLAGSVQDIDKTCRRLKHVSFAFMALLIVLAVMVGLLGEEVLPKALSWLWALVGL